MKKRRFKVSAAIRDDFVKMKTQGVPKAYKSVPSKIEIDKDILAALKQLTTEPIEYAGMLHYDGTLIHDMSLNPGEDLSSFIPDSQFNYHTHSSTAYKHGNNFNYPSSDDLMTLLILSLPIHDNVMSFVSSKEGIYTIQIQQELKNYVLENWMKHPIEKIVQLYKEKQEQVQNLIDKTLYEHNINAYLIELNNMGWIVKLYPWDLSQNLIIYPTP